MLGSTSPLATPPVPGLASDVPEFKHVFNELHYEMTRKIADGGMGIVYEAIQRGAGQFKKIVAVKLIRE